MPALRVALTDPIGRRAAGHCASGDYFFNSIPDVLAIRLTDPAWRPSSAAIFDTTTPARASLTSRRTSCSAHCVGFGVFMMGRAMHNSEKVRVRNCYFDERSHIASV